MLRLTIALAIAVGLAAPLEYEGVPVAGRIVDAHHGRPVAGLVLEIRGSREGAQKERVLTDSEGRFGTESGFSVGEIELISQENRVARGLGRVGDRGIVEWSGTELSVKAWPGPRFEFSLRLPGANGVQAPMPRAVLGQVPSGLRVFGGSVDPWRMQFASSNWSRGVTPFADLRLPMQKGEPLWARFSSGLFEPYYFPSRGMGILDGERDLIVADNAGHWLGRAELPSANGLVSCDLLPTASIEFLVAEAPLGTRPPGKPRKWKEFREPYPYKTVPITFTPLDQAGAPRPDLARHTNATIGAPLAALWLSPGTWRIESDTRFFPAKFRDVELVAGANTMPAFLLGERMPVASIAALVRDFDGDLIGPDATHNYAGPIRTDQLLPWVELHSLDGGYGRYAPSYVSCATGVTTWCEVNDRKGKRRRIAEFEYLSSGNYIVTAQADGRYAVPSFHVAKPGENVRFTLRPFEPESGYWVRARSSVGGEPIRVETQSLVVPFAPTFASLSGGDLAMACFVAPEWPREQAAEICVAAHGFQRKYLTSTDFYAEGERHLAEIELTPGWALRLALRDEQGNLLPEIEVAFAGRTFQSNAQGEVLLFSDESYPREIPVFGTYECTLDSVQLMGLVYSGENSISVSLVP